MKITKRQIAQFNLMLATLKKISKGYETPDQLAKRSEKDWGCEYVEALEMAYENIQEEARRAAKGVRLLAEPAQDNESR